MNKYRIGFYIFGAIQCGLQAIYITNDLTIPKVLTVSFSLFGFWMILIEILLRLSEYRKIISIQQDANRLKSDSINRIVIELGIIQVALSVLSDLYKKLEEKNELPSNNRE